MLGVANECKSRGKRGSMVHVTQIHLKEKSDKTVLVTLTRSSITKKLIW
jgi:hypothetical protein